jgi:hypothetical protein
MWIVMDDGVWLPQLITGVLIFVAGGLPKLVLLSKRASPMQAIQLEYFRFAFMFLFTFQFCLGGSHSHGHPRRFVLIRAAAVAVARGNCDFD